MAVFINKENKSNAKEFKMDINIEPVIEAVRELQEGLDEVIASNEEIKEKTVTLDNGLEESRDKCKTDIFKDITDKMLDTYKRKNNDYGDSFCKVRREYPNSICIRLSDKMERLKTLKNGSKQMVDESIKDTLIDMANYAILELIEMEIEENERI